MNAIAPDVLLNEDEMLTNGTSTDESSRRLRMHADEEHAAGAIDPEIRAQWDRAAESAHQAWVDSIRLRACDKAAADVAASGSALLLWTDSDGRLQARRISREESMVREWVPDYLRRRSGR